MRASIIALLIAAPALADGPEGPLAGRSVTYESGATQRFLVSGRTVHNPVGEGLRYDSWGRWEMRGGAYCSTWPPADGWDCYALRVEGDRVSFIGAAGDVTAGVLDPP